VLPTARLVTAPGDAGGGGLQFARHFGTEVTAVCSTRKKEQSRSLGADYVIDYTKEDFAVWSRRYNLILAVNGNYPLLRCRRILKSGGIYVMIGGTLKQIFKALLFGRFLSFGSRKIRSLAAKPNREDIGFISKLAEEGRISPVIQKSYPFEKTEEVMHHAGECHARGKVVIHVAGSPEV